jgi:serine/threonine protein kinase
MPLQAGDRLGRYEIRSLLGIGGMGEVYLADDSRLQRKVALKLLTGHWATNEERLRRFAQEARAASALNHPNIVTVYDVDLDGDPHFITTEFIEGETLRSRLRRGHVSLPEALRIATQVADALTAAHREGIVHRDIKPENILLRPDGYAKVVDFGLAKLTGAPTADETIATTRAVVDTSAGVILGTAAYMSPEQARGLAVDPRTDVWSLGVVLYEMIAGRRPFDGPTSSDLIVSILQKQPPNLAAFTREVTGEVDLVVETALAKEVEERYQSARDLANVLKRVQKHLDTDAERERALAPTPPANVPARAAVSSAAGTSSLQPTPVPIDSAVRTPAVQRITVASWAALVVSIVLGGSGYALYKYLPRDRSLQPTGSFDQFRIARLTSSSDVLDAAISPDGRYVVHSVDDGPGQSLWVRQVNTKSNIQIVRTANVSYIGMTFSKEGDYVYYVSRQLDQGGAALYQIPVLGGPPKKLLDDVDTAVTLSPDGSRLAFVRGSADGSTSLVVSRADGTAQQRLATLGSTSVFADGWEERMGPAWSPDGTVIASVIIRTSGPHRGVEIAVVDVHTGQVKPLASRPWYMVRRLAWLADGSGLLAAAADKSSAYSAQQVWRISYPSGETGRITNDLSNYGGVSVTATGGAFVTTQSSTTAEISVSVKDDPSAALVITPSRSTFDGRYGLSWTPDGQILYSSATNGTYDLWIMKADGSDRAAVITNAGASLYPDVSRDGKTVVLTSDRASDIFQVWRVGIDGADMTLVTQEETAWWPKVLADDSILYGAADRLWRVSLGGGAALRVTDTSTWRPAVSPDGSSFVCAYRKESTARVQLAVYQIGGTTPRQLFDIPATADSQAQWSPDGRSVQYVDTRDGVSNIWNLSLTGGPATPLTHFKSDRIFAFAWSRDGKRLALSRGAVASDAVLITAEGRSTVR